jgi:glycerate kinase
VYAVVGSVHEDLGDYAGNFDDVIVAGDAAAMVAAGTRLAPAAGHALR